MANLRNLHSFCKHIWLVNQTEQFCVKVAFWWNIFVTWWTSFILGNVQQVFTRLGGLERAWHKLLIWCCIHIFVINGIQEMSIEYWKYGLHNLKLFIIHSLILIEKQSLPKYSRIYKLLAMKTALYVMMCVRYIFYDAGQ